MFKDIHIKLKCLYTKQKMCKKLSCVLFSYVAKLHIDLPFYIQCYSLGIIAFILFHLQTK